MKATPIQVTYVPVSELLPYARNSRTHSPTQVEQIAASIGEFGFTSPMLIDERRTIIAGHGRLMAAKLRGMHEVPCIVLDGLTDAQKRALVIADNRLAENAAWDEDMLVMELGDLVEEIDLTVTGFTQMDLERLLSADVPPPPVEPKSGGDATEHTCPACGYHWIKGHE